MVVESSTKKLLGVVALVYLLPVVGFLLGYFLTEGLMSEGWPLRGGGHRSGSVFPAQRVLRQADQEGRGSLTYTILRLF